jgi:hypothetical protein
MVADEVSLVQPSFVRAPLWHKCLQGRCKCSRPRRCCKMQMQYTQYGIQQNVLWSGFSRPTRSCIHFFPGRDTFNGLRVRLNDCYRTTHISGEDNTYMYQYNRITKDPLHTWPSFTPCISCNVYESNNPLDDNYQNEEQGISVMIRYSNMPQPFFLLLPLFRRLSPPCPLPLVLVAS